MGRDLILIELRDHPQQLPTGDLANQAAMVKHRSTAMTFLKHIIGHIH
jgi:hypothetical protein